MPVSSITPATAPCSAPPSEVKSFWYSIRTIAVCFGSSAMGLSLALWTAAPEMLVVAGQPIVRIGVPARKAAMSSTTWPYMWRIPPSDT